MLEQNKLVTRKKGSLWFYYRARENREKEHLANGTGQNTSFPRSKKIYFKFVLNMIYKINALLCWTALLGVNEDKPGHASKAVALQACGTLEQRFTCQQLQLSQLAMI